MSPAVVESINWFPSFVAIVYYLSKSGQTEPDCVDQEFTPNQNHQIHQINHINVSQWAGGGSWAKSAHVRGPQPGIAIPSSTTIQYCTTIQQSIPNHTNPLHTKPISTTVHQNAANQTIPNSAMIHEIKLYRDTPKHMCTVHHWSLARAWQSVNFGFSARRSLIDHIQQIQPWPKQSAPPHHEILPLTAIKGPLPPTSPPLNTSINYCVKTHAWIQDFLSFGRDRQLKLTLALILSQLRIS